MAFYEDQYKMKIILIEPLQDYGWVQSQIVQPA